MIHQDMTWKEKEKSYKNFEGNRIGKKTEMMLNFILILKNNGKRINLAQISPKFSAQQALLKQNLRRKNRNNTLILKKKSNKEELLKSLEELRKK